MITCFGLVCKAQQDTIRCSVRLHPVDANDPFVALFTFLITFSALRAYTLNRRRMVACGRSCHFVTFINYQLGLCSSKGTESRAPLSEYSPCHKARSQEVPEETLRITEYRSQSVMTAALHV